MEQLNGVEVARKDMKVDNGTELAKGTGVKVLESSRAEKNKFGLVISPVQSSPQLDMMVQTFSRDSFRLFPKLTNMCYTGGALGKEGQGNILPVPIIF